MEKMRLLPNGQWELKKYDEKSYGHIHDTNTSVPVGKHTVEIHPHMDHLYNVKGQIKDSGKDKLKVSHLKDAGFDKGFLDKHVPKDGQGWISEKMIDDHIAKLPKQKVDVHVAPYNMKSQQHRDGNQHVVSVHLHDDTVNNMDPEHKENWNTISGSQHKFEGIDSENQMGWARIDPKGHHWHIDEIQSDFQNTKKIEAAPGRTHRDNDEPGDYDENEYGEDGYRFSYSNITNSQAKKLHDHLSHGHDDPQHAIHSAVNQLARKHNVQSMSMDTPEDQAKQSSLRIADNSENERSDWIMENAWATHEELWENHEAELKSGKHDIFQNPNFKSAFDKIGGYDTFKRLVDQTGGTGSSVETLRMIERANQLDQEEGRGHNPGPI